MARARTITRCCCCDRSCLKLGLCCSLQLMPSIQTWYGESVAVGINGNMTLFVVKSGCNLFREKAPSSQIKRKVNHLKCNINIFWRVCLLSSLSWQLLLFHLLLYTLTDHYYHIPSFRRILIVFLLIFGRYLHIGMSLGREGNCIYTTL